MSVVSIIQFCLLLDPTGVWLHLQPLQVSAGGHHGFAAARQLYTAEHAAAAGAA
jgi:hypothetical protein